jgi:cleavage and polyadenylation specificity factor subunit 3
MVDSSSEALRRRVEAVLEMAVSTVSSLSESFASGAPEEFTSSRIHKQKADVSPSDAAEVDHESPSLGVETQRPDD